MRELPEKGILKKILCTIRTVSAWEIPAHAAGTCYFLALSVFPAVVLLLALLKYTTFGVEDLMEVLEGVVPAALMPHVGSLLEKVYAQSSQTLISLSALVALWSAGRGIYGLQRGLNAVYEVEETRNYLLVRARCMIYTFLFLLVLLLTLVLHVFGSMILGSVPISDHPLLSFLSDVVDFRFFLLLGVQTAVFCVMYCFLPNRRSSVKACLPGAVLASVGWLIFSDVFSIYVENMQHYSGIFGSVYAVALSMLWLYFCICLVFYGGALNRWLLRGRKQDC